ncbi:MAG: hypothetical protein JXR70_11135 [Spirochaetales bacterium]|nr:hypothetical protein [Spirochaetales bacterium]
MNRNNLVMIISPIIIILFFIFIIFTCQIKTLEKIHLDAPFELKAQVKSNSVVLNWKWHGSSVGISGFILERKTDDEGFRGIGLTSGFSFEDWQPPLEKNHIYRVIFFQGDDKSLPSNEVEVNLVSKEVKVIPDPVQTPRPKPINSATPIKATNPPPRKTEAPNLALGVNNYVEKPIETEKPGKPTAHPFESLYETVIDAPENARSGYIWFTPVASIVNEGTEFFVEVHANTGNQLLAAYGFEVVYNPSILQVNSKVGESGVEPGKKGFVAAVNNLPSGKLLVSGFDTLGKGPNINLHLANIHFTAKKEGMTRLEMIVNNMVDPLTRPIGKGLGISGTIEVITAPQEYPIYTAMNDSISDQPSDNDDNSENSSYDTADTYDYQNENYNQEIYQPDDYYESYNTPSNANNDPVNVYDFPEEPETTIYFNTPAPEPERTEAPRVTAAPIRVTEAPRKNYPPGAGLAWFEPSTSTQLVGKSFVVEIHVNSGDSKVAAYGFRVKFNPNLLKMVNKGQNGVEPGKDGYVAAVSYTNGTLTISGFDVAGKGPGKDLTMVKINFMAQKTGSTTLDLTVMNLVDSTTEEIGNPQGKSGRVEIN